MSEKAIATLNKMWRTISIFPVSRIVFEDPKDVLSIHIMRTVPAGNGLLRSDGIDYKIDSNRIADILPGDVWKAQVSLKYYKGYTPEGIHFYKNNYLELDFDVSLTCDWSTWGNHMGGWNLPPEGTKVAGVRHTPFAQKLYPWFFCSPQLELLIDIVRNGTSLSEAELAPKLLTDHYSDKYWALLRLVLFDNVQAFIDQYRDDAPTHPAYGQEYPNPWYLGPVRPTVTWSGMDLPNDAATYVHTLSYLLNEPNWWLEFQRLAKEQGIHFDHPMCHGACEACEADSYRR